MKSKTIQSPASDPEDLLSICEGLTYSELTDEEFQSLGNKPWPISKYESRVFCSAPRENTPGWFLVVENEKTCYRDGPALKTPISISADCWITPPEERAKLFEAFIQCGARDKDLSMLRMLYVRALNAAGRSKGKLAELADALGHYVFSPDPPILLVPRIRCTMQWSAASCVKGLVIEIAQSVHTLPLSRQPSRGLWPLELLAMH